MTTIPIANDAFSPRSAFVTSVGRGFSLMYGIATVGLIYGIVTLASIPGVPHWRLLMAAALVVDVGTLIAAVGLLGRRPWARATFIAALCVSLVQSFAYAWHASFRVGSVGLGAGHRGLRPALCLDHR